MTIREYRRQLDQRIAERAVLRKQFNETRRGIRTLEKKHEDALKAREVINLAVQTTQEQLEYHVANVVTMALAAIPWKEDPYNFVVDFVQRRNSTECDLKFEKYGNELKPEEGSGCGAIDIASLALRVAFWSMSTGLRPVIILDEPLKHLSEDYQPKASEMIKMLSDKLGIQFIIVSHKDDHTLCADKVFNVTMKKKISYVEVEDD